MRSCLCLLALFTTTALGSWQYYLEEESDSCDDEDFVFDEEGCLHCQVEGNEEGSIAVNKRGRRTGENSVLKPRWTSTLQYFFIASKAICGSTRSLSLSLLALKTSLALLIMTFVFA